MIQRTDLEMLKSRMKKLEEVKASSKKLKDAFDMENKSFVDAKSELEKEISELKIVIGEAAIAEFKMSGEKKQLGGVKVQEKKWSTISYDSTEALRFAKDKDMFLLLDKKGFETAAPSLNLDFVTIESGTKEAVTFPKEIKLED